MALEVLLERVAPSASPLIQRLPRENAHTRVSTLLDFLVRAEPAHGTEGGGSTEPSGCIATSEVLFGMETPGPSANISQAPTGDSPFTGTNYDGTILEGSRETSSMLMSSTVGREGPRVSSTGTMTEGLESRMSAVGGSRLALHPSLSPHGPRSDPMVEAVALPTGDVSGGMGPLTAASTEASARYNPTPYTTFETALSEVMATPHSAPCSPLVSGEAIHRQCLLGFCVRQCIDFLRPLW
jgi:hypothetical protein